jgi:hypothetical protein
MAEETERQRLERIAGSKVVPYEMKKEARDLAAQNRIYTQAIESGKTEEEANQLVAQSGIGSATPRLDRMAAEQRQLEASRGTQSDLGGFKTYGDKSTFEAKNAVRKLQGLEPLSAPLPANQQFIVDLEKSASFGMESALVGDKAPKGQARAFEAGIRAGYTPEETRKLISDTAARITGIVDQQKEKQQFISDFAEAGKGAVTQPVGMLTPVERTSADLDKSFFGGLTKNTPAPVTPTPVTPIPVAPATAALPTPQPPAPTVKRPEAKSSVGSTASVRFGELPYNEQTSDAEKYRRLTAEGYTPEQAFQMMGVKPTKIPDWLQGTAVGGMLEGINAPK